MANILVAGVDTACMETLCAELEAEGHAVRLGADGHEAYDLAQQTQPDLVFLETEMPVFDGYETCAMLRGDPDFSPTLPIVLLTSGDHDRKRAEHAGISLCLAKFHAVHDLRDLLARHLDANAAS